MMVHFILTRLLPLSLSHLLLVFTFCQFWTDWNKLLFSNFVGAYKLILGELKWCSKCNKFCLNFLPLIQALDLHFGQITWFAKTDLKFIEKGRRFKLVSIPIWYLRYLYHWMAGKLIMNIHKYNCIIHLNLLVHTSKLINVCPFAVPFFCTRYKYILYNEFYNH